MFHGLYDSTTIWTLVTQHGHDVMDCDTSVRVTCHVHEMTCCTAVRHKMATVWLCLTGGSGQWARRFISLGAAFA